MLTILHTESSLGWGGQEIRIHQEALGMKARGHRVLVAAQPGSELLRRSREAGLETLGLSMRRRAFLASLRRLYRWIRQQRVDVLNTHSSRDSWLAFAAAGFLRLPPVLVRTRHLSTPVRPRWSARLLYARLPHRVVTTGETIRQALIRHLGCPPEQVVSIPTGVDLERFRPGLDGASLREACNIPPSAVVVGNVAVLRSWKGHRDLMEGVFRIRCRGIPAHLVIAGDGPQRKPLEAYVRERGFGGWVHLLGHREDVPRVLAMFSVYVQASHGHEGVPQSLIQAMAAGIPCVCTDIGSVRDVVRPGETGLLAPPRDPDALSREILRILEDPERGIRMARQARALVEREFALERMLDRMEALYREILAEKGR